MRSAHAVFAAASILFAPLASSADSGQGLDAYNSADYETALAVWQPLAEADDIGAQFGLGLMYGNGFGVMMDDALSIKWYGLAAEQGHAQAQCNLAVMYQNGWGVPQDDVAAMALFAAAAEQGTTEAMVALGRFYALDFSDDYDPVQAYKWFSLAYLLENMDAGVKRETLVSRMTVEQIAEGSGLVEAWSNGHTSLLANQK